MENRKLGHLMGYILLGAGVGHVIFPSALDSIGLALLTPLEKKVAGKAVKLWGAYGAFALFLAVYPANINMAIQWSDRPMPEPLIAYARLPFQFYFLYAAWQLIKVIKRRLV